MPLLAQETRTSEMPWFDMEHCAFCKNMAGMEDRMADMMCDTHKIDNGMMMVAFVPDDLKAAMRKADQAMMDTVKRLEAGEQLAMCGFCQQIGMLMSKGVKMQKLVGEHGEVTLFTTDDPELVKVVHEFADRTIKETKAHHERLSRAG
jgi:hypothetical protein